MKRPWYHLHLVTCVVSSRTMGVLLWASGRVAGKGDVSSLPLGWPLFVIDMDDNGNSLAA